MSELGKPNRKWFQFHLATAVLLMFVAGGMIWQNSDYRRVEAADYVLIGRGWPFIFQPYYYWLKNDIAVSSFFASGYMIYAYLGLDIFTALFLLLLTAFVSEYLLRRREGRKP